jgi:hypothetical protein
VRSSTPTIRWGRIIQDQEVARSYHPSSSSLGIVIFQSAGIELLPLRD